MFQVEQDVEDTAVDSTTEDNQTDHEIDSTPESNDASGAETIDTPKSETAEQRLARLKRQYEREAKKQGIKGDGDSAKTDKEEDLDARYEEKYNRLALKQDGYTDKAEQDAIIKYSRFEGIDVEEAVKSPVAQAIIKGLRDKAATPGPSSRTSKNGAPTIDGLVAKYKAGKYLAPSEMKEVRKKLRG